MKRIIRSLSVSVAALATTLTLAGAGTAAATSMSNTGPWSYGGNYYTHRHLHRNLRPTTNISNTNTVVVTNNTTQVAQTGNATVSHNLFGGSARSGDAMNYANTSTSVNIRN